MRPPLRCKLGDAGVFNAKLFAQQCAFFVEPIVLRCESHAGIDAVGCPSACVYNGVAMSNYWNEWVLQYGPDSQNLLLDRLAYPEATGAS